MRRFGCMVALVALQAAAVAGAQSLGEMAQKEKQRREGATKAGDNKPADVKPAESRPADPKPADAKPKDKKVYTVEDLEPYAASRPAESADGESRGPAESVGLENPSGPGSSPPRAGGRSPMGIADDSVERAAQEQTWRGRAAAARAAVTAAEAGLKDAEAQRGRLGPGPPPYQDHASWAATARAADARLARAQSTLQAAKKNLEQLEDDARRAGVPAGWVR